MSRISFNYYDKDKLELAKKYLEEQGIGLNEALSVFLDAVVMNEGMPNADALEDAEDRLIREKVIDNDILSS